jgi:hypothetical protein
MGSNPKIYPPGLVSDFQVDKKSSINKISFIGRNTCPILAFNGFPKSPGSFASFLYGRLANQRIGSHPKILPTRFVSDFQAAALLPRAAATSITRVLTQGRKDNVLPYVRPELFNTIYNGRWDCNVFKCPNKVHQRVQRKLAVILTYWVIVSQPSLASQNCA